MKNDTEENDAFKIDHVRGTEENDAKRKMSLQKRRINHNQMTRKEHTRFQNNKTQTEKERQ